MGSALDVARPFIGRAVYVWAAQSPNANPPAFDCSGLTRYAYAEAYGIGLPHNSAAQSALGTAVAEADAQPNDLVFFKTAGVVHHVGIVSGPNSMVAAQNPSAGIKQASISGDGRPYHFRRYAGVPRSGGTVSGTMPAAGSVAASSGPAFNWNPINDAQVALGVDKNLITGGAGAVVGGAVSSTVQQVGKIMVLGIAIVAGASLVVLGIFKASGADAATKSAVAQAEQLAPLAAL